MITEWSISDIEWDNYMAHVERGAPFIEKYYNAKTYFGQLSALRDMYLNWLVPENKDQRCYDFPHSIDIYPLFSVAEMMVSQDMAYFAMKMYPQYPILNYFVDFADPYRKVAIEVDGAQYHTDGEKELRRHKEIEAEGWTLYHITGADSMRHIDQFFELPNKRLPDDDGEYYPDQEDEFRIHRDKLLITTSSGIVCCIKRTHYPERHNFESFYLPEDGDIGYLIDEIRHNFIARCRELIQKKSK